MCDENVDLGFVNNMGNTLGTNEEREHLLENDELAQEESETIQSNGDLLPAVRQNTEVNSVQPTTADTPVSKWSIVAVAIMTFINLLNYMDRYSVAGVLKDIKLYYDINDTLAGLISTTFIISYMLLSPLFGFLGDRYNRKLIMACGIFVWSSVTAASSFVGPSLFGVFLFLRALVGIGEASYSTIAPTIIADLFVGTKRTFALTVFNFAIPVGSGLGYIIGSEAAHIFGGWQWALRVTPVFGVASSVLIMFLLREPKRGQSDHSTAIRTTSWSADIKYILTHKSFMLSSLGFTCVAFVTGALAFWAPTYITKSIAVSNPNISEDDVKVEVSMIFGGITCAAGFIGVTLGSFAVSKLRPCSGKADPYVCAFGLLSSAPFLWLSLTLSSYSAPLTWGSIFIGETLLCLNWTIVTDMLLYLVIPTRRASAEAVQILMSHLFGDAGSPALVGAISDAIQGSYSVKGVVIEFLGLKYALYMTCFVCALGGACFLGCACFIEKDKAETEKIESGAKDEQDETNTANGSIAEDAGRTRSSDLLDCV